MAKFIHPKIVNGSVSFGDKFFPVVWGVVELSIEQGVASAGVGLLRVTDAEAAEYQAARKAAAGQ